MSDTAAFPYETRLNILHPALEVIDVQALADACTFQWYNQTLCQVNGSVVRVGVMQGEYHWHKHDEDDEFFFILDGRFLIDLEDRTVVLGAGWFWTQLPAVRRVMRPIYEEMGILPPSQIIAEEIGK